MKCPADGGPWNGVAEKLLWNEFPLECEYRRFDGGLVARGLKAGWMFVDGVDGIEGKGDNGSTLVP